MYHLVQSTIIRVLLYLLYTCPPSFFFAKMPYSKSQLAISFLTNSVCVNNSLVSCNTQAIFNLFQLSQKYLVTVGLFQTGSKLSCHIIFNCDIVLTFFFNLEHCSSLSFFTPLTCNLLIVFLKEFK